MPLYEFRCPQGHDFEKFYRSIGSSVAEERCPECGTVAGRLMSTAGLVFKGSGFYITDYGKDGKKAERDAATAKAAPKGDAKAGEGKPAETTAPASDAAAPAATAKPAGEAKPASAPTQTASAPKKAS